MPELPGVSEDFTADASGYLAAIQAMIDETRRLIDTVNELHAVIDALPDLKEIEVNVTGDALETIAAIREELGDLDDRTIVVNVVYRNGGGPDVRDATQVVYEETVGQGGSIVNEDTSGGFGPEQAGQLEAMGQAIQQVAEDLQAAAPAADKGSEALSKFTEALVKLLEATTALTEFSSALGEMIAKSNEAGESLHELSDEAKDAGDSIADDALDIGKVVDQLDGFISSASEAKDAADGLGESQDQVADAVGKVTEALGGDDAAAAKAAETMSDLEESQNTVKTTLDQIAKSALLSSDATINLARSDMTLHDALVMLGDVTEEAETKADYFQKVIEAAGGNVDDFNADVDKGHSVMLSFALAAKAVGDNVGGITIPLGAAAFGITGVATAIHLIVMGIFEFSAVFIPAMFAAAAAAAVLNQGVMNVYDGLKGVEIAGESLGPMFGKTQGDMLGLGHSLQVAQNAADPDAYELLGEAIQGVNDATGHLNDQLGAVTHTSGDASQGISSFGKMGLSVGQILEKFAADIDIDLQNGMTQFTGLLSDGVQDLVEFGQIFGNIGRAILNLASDMPGLAEIILKIIDGISDLIKIISELPHTLIEVIMAIEEAYRWSGLLVGVFGLLGRAIALVGTLGIPVFAKIGMNMGAMVANVLSGVGSMIVNFTALIQRIGLVKTASEEMVSTSAIEDEAALMSGAFVEIDTAATRVVGALGSAAAFMSGPWGAAIMLAVAGLTALTIWFLRTKTSTQDFIGGIQAAVQAASNLNALNVVAQSLTQNTAQLNAAQETLNNKVGGSGLVMQAAGLQIVHTGSEYGLLGNIIDTVIGSIDGSNASLEQQKTAVTALSSEQQNLYQQTQNLISGADMISKAYGVSFTTALGMADAANVKLINGISGNGKTAEEARIQIQGLYQGYQAMDQSGSTLSNSMAAVSVQAQIQGSKVSTLNSAWDAFMNNALGLTGSFSQINLDLQQMGNIASATPDKISAFAGATTLSINQIAESLKGFKGTSAQTWQAYNQSLSEAETFTDSLRTAAASNVVTQGQFVQAISGVVNMMLPYAKDSKTAVAELSILAQEAGGPATSNFATLKSWVDQTGGATVNLGGLVDTLTQKLTNVTAVAKTFAGTLQSDVLSAIANAAVGTSSVTGLTQKYTDALQENGDTAPTTMAAQKALETEIVKIGFTETEAKQVVDELSTAYNNNAAAADNQTGAIDTLGGAAETLSSTFNGKTRLAVDTLRSHTDDLTQQYISGLMPAMGDVGDKAKSTASGPLSQLQEMTESIHSWTQQTENVMRQWPSSEHTTVSVTGIGGASIHSNIPQVPGGVLRITPYAGGGVIPGYSPGVDSVVALLSPGEGVLTPQATKALGGESGISRINQRFAAGGIVLPNAGGTAGDILSTSTSDITDALRSALVVAMAHYQNEYNAYSSSAGGAVSGTVMGWLSAALRADGAPLSWLPALAWLTNAESSGNPNAVNPTVVDGQHATGLLQTLPSTFWAYMNPAVPGGILDPIANAAAAIRYIESVYGSPFNIPGIFHQDKGFDDGGWLMPGLTLARNSTGQPERVIGPNGGGEAGVIHNVVNLDGKQIFESMKPYVYQYNARNNGAGNISGAWAPNRTGNTTR